MEQLQDQLACVVDSDMLVTKVRVFRIPTALRDSSDL